MKYIKGLIITLIFMFVFTTTAYSQDYRSYGLGAIPSDVSDITLYNNIQPTSDSTITYPDEYIYPYLIPEVLNQGQYPMCVAYSLRAVKDMFALEHGNYHAHSAAFIYSNRELLGDWNMEGMITQQALLNMKQRGVCTDNLFPLQGYYSTLSPLITVEMRTEAENHKLTNFEKIVTDNDTKNCLINVSSVPIIFPVFDEFYKTGKDGILIIPDKTGRTYGCHEVVIVGWKLINGKEYWIILNSWGSNWGDNGYGYMPMDYPILERWAIWDSETTPKLIPEVNFTEISFTLTTQSINIKNPVYQWWLKDSFGNWTCTKDYSDDNTFNVNGLNPGNYEVVVYSKEKNASWETAIYQDLTNILYIH